MSTHVVLPFVFRNVLRIIFKDAAVMIILTDQIFLMPNSEMILNDPNREMPLRPTVSYFSFTRLQSRLFPRRIRLQWRNSGYSNISLVVEF